MPKIKIVSTAPKSDRTYVDFVDHLGRPQKAIRFKDDRGWISYPYGKEYPFSIHFDLEDALIEFNNPGYRLRTDGEGHAHGQA